jgi:ubiquinone/menaquinone biosynthesis C-methylase UbiE
MERDTIQSYWNQRAEGFSLSNKEQLRSDASGHWMALLEEHAPSKKKLRCLDIGCGPGFLAILLAKLGHDVSAIDYTENMLKQAKRNAEAENVTIDFRRMDAQQLTFADNSFDYIVSRNLTWNLEYPEQAYNEWLRVLGSGGRIFNYDGNYYLYHFNPLYRQYVDSDAFVDPHKTEHLQGVDTNVMEDVARRLPLSKIERPSWDLEFFVQAGVSRITCEMERPSFIGLDGQVHKVIKNFSICVEK